MRKGMLGIAMVLVMLAGVAEAITLPGEGEDSFDATADLVLSLVLPESAQQSMSIAQPLGQLNTVECSGPTKIMRKDPRRGETGEMIETEMVSLDLSCSNGIKIHLNPNSNNMSTGEIQPVDAHFDSFFDVFFEIEIPNVGTLSNVDPVRVQGKTDHIPFVNICHFGTDQEVSLFQGDILMGTLRLGRYCVHRPKPETVGEVSPVFSCFYECKADKVNKNWLELTTLMLVNQSRHNLTAQLVFFDGSEHPIATALTNLSPQDLDEINVCETLRGSAGQTLTVPPAGVIEVVLSLSSATGFFPAGGAYGWVKNLTGSFKRSVVEPFSGKVTGIAKTECRLVGPNVITPQEILKKVQAPTNIPILTPILIERTAD